MFRLDDQNVYRAESLEQFPWLEHGFGTRLSNGWPDGSRLVTAKQVHSNEVLVVENGAPAGPDARIGRGDALISVEPEPMVGIRTAEFHSFRRDREKAGRMLSVVGHKYTKGAGRNPRPL